MSVRSENRQAADATEAGLTPLTGVSDRQIAYGETCRAEMLPVIVDFAMPVYEAPKIRAWLASKTEASFWCDLKNPPLYIGLSDQSLGGLLVYLYYKDTGVLL